MSQLVVCGVADSLSRSDCSPAFGMLAIIKFPNTFHHRREGSRWGLWKEVALRSVESKVEYVS